MTSENPRLFDGPILALHAIDPASTTLHARPDRFAHVACARQDRAVPTTILSVTGIVRATVDGRPCVLLARRGGATRSYPGMWEFAPAGGLHAVHGPAHLGLEHVLSTLRDELAEEVGITAALQTPAVRAVVLDGLARSADIVVEAWLAGTPRPVTPAGEHHWECQAARWQPIETLGAFLGQAPGGVIAPTLAIARHMGWIASRKPG